MKYRLKRSRIKYCEKSRKINDFINENITIEKPENHKALHNLIRSTSAFIAGSDQLWNPNAPIRREFLLDFETKERVAKFSYAVSLGVRDITEKQGKMFSTYLKEFSAVSLREESGKNCLEKYADVPLRVDVDPTLLFNGEFWGKTARQYKAFNSDYIFVYMLRPDKKTMAFAQKLSKMTGLKIVYIGNLYFEQQNIITVTDAGVEEFLGLIRNAAYVVTNSFHGTAFSVQFRKKLFSVALKGTGDRAKELLDKLEIGNLIVSGRESVKEIDRLVDVQIDYDTVEGRLEQLRNESVKYLTEIVEISKNTDITKIPNAAECCGCGVCEAICHKNAITMTTAKDGFVYPELDKSKCVGCGRCETVCPVKNKSTGDVCKKAYAAVISDKDRLKNSASGGAFYAIAHDTIERGGVVFGAAQLLENNRLVTRHIMVDKAEDICKCQGSKYVQSSTANIFPQVKEKLEQNVEVFFSGTPCQVSALKNYLGKNYANLFTADLICHGVPSEKMFQDFIRLYEEKNKCKVTKFIFRHKKNGWNCETIEITHINSVAKYKYCYSVSYMYYFLKAYIYRDSCYECQYADSNRAGDITIGDLWGVDITYPELLKQKKYSNREGISCVLCNTDAGVRKIELCKHAITTELIEYTDVAAYNGSLRKPCDPPPGRMALLRAYEKSGYAALEKKYSALGKMFSLHNRIISVVPHMALFERKLKLLYASIRKRTR